MVRKKYFLVLVLTGLFVFCVPLIYSLVLIDWIYPQENINVSQNYFFNISVNVSCFGDDCGEMNVTLDPSSYVYNFTSCSVTGQNGPTQEQCDSEYSGTTLGGLVNVTSGIQYWVVPYTGIYTIEARGAKGGGAGGGNGTKMQGDFQLAKGTVLKILVGQRGELGHGSAGSSNSGGGGGGTFIINSNNSIYLIAAGGGGGNGDYGSAYPNNPNGDSGNVETSGSSTYSGGGGTDGNGGDDGITDGQASGGGGFYTNGQNGGSDSTGGASFLNNGTGGNGNTGSYPGGNGGFGGGGGGNSNVLVRGGGGGGYSGGQGGTYAYSSPTVYPTSSSIDKGYGGGGGSYNGGDNQNNTASFNTEDGLVVISFTGGAKDGTVSTDVGEVPYYTNVTNPYNISIGDGESQIITWWLNATGIIDIPSNFFIYANMTSNLSISNQSSKLNITIKDTTAPVIGLFFPANTTYGNNISDVNYSYSDFNGGGFCWYSLDDGSTNSSVVSAGTNFSNVNFADGENNLILYCNDSSGNLASDSVDFNIDIPSINLEIIYPLSNVNATQNETFIVRAKVTCVNADCGEINVSLDPATNRTMRTCSGVWGESCDGADPSVSDYSYDSCSSGTYYSSGFWVDEVYVDATTVAIGDEITITCNFDCYSTSSYNDLAINYYNGTWNQVWKQDRECIDGNYSVNVTVSGEVGEQYARCSMGYYYYNPTGTCFTTTYSDNDDVNFTVVEAVKTGLVSMNLSATPFYTTTQNPYNLTLNEDESATITWTVNATGDLNQTHEFFVYVNKTSYYDIGNISGKWNVTIVDFEVDTDMDYPVFSEYWDDNGTLYDSGIGNFNVTIENTNGSVLLEINGTNITALNLSESVYNVSYQFSLPGVYSYKWHSWGNGTNENYNSSVSMNYSVIDSCVPDMINSSWSAWQNQSSCGIDDLQLQNRTRIYYDQNSCNEIENTTYIEYQNISCNYCSYNVVNSSFSSWANLSCLSDNKMNQSRSKTEYDSNSEICYSVTNLASDLWNSGENKTHYEFRNILYCNYDEIISAVLNSPSENYRIDSSDVESVTFNCSVSALSELANVSLFLTNGSNENFELNMTTNLSGTTNSTSWELNLSSGNYTWNCFVEDVSGNNSFAESNRTIFIGFLDDDNDSVRNSLDTLNGSLRDINSSGFSNLSVVVGSDTNLTSFDGVQNVLVYDDESLFVNFSYNFSDSDFDLGKVSFVKGDNYVLVNLSGQLQTNYNKTIYLEDIGFSSLCVKDAEVESVDDLSSSCDAVGEMDFSSCFGGNYSRDGIECVDEGSVIEIYNLRHSVVRGTLPSTAGITGGSSGSPGGSSSSTSEGLMCNPLWNCSSWSFCNINFTQTRICRDLNDCGTDKSKPLEFRECPDILFDVNLDLKKTKFFSWQELEFLVDLKEVNQDDLVDVEVSYEILKNEEVVYSEKETISISDIFSYSKVIDGLDLDAGDYSLKVLINYGKNQTASSEHPFKILQGNKIIFYILLFVFILVSLFLIYHGNSLAKERKKFFEYISHFEKFLKKKKLHLIKIPLMNVSRKPVIRLDESERNVLTLLEGVKREDGIKLIKKYLGYSEIKIDIIIYFLIKKKLLKSLLVYGKIKNVKWYFHTTNVKADMINDSLRFKKNLGWDFKEVLDSKF